MKKTILFGATALVAGCLTLTAASAQIQWTPEQKEVWKTETTINELFLKGDLQSAYQYLDDNFQGWPSVLPAPVSKKLSAEHAKYYSESGGKVAFSQLVPLRIWVNGNYAYTDYYDYEVYEDKSDKKKSYTVSEQDVLLKKEGKWTIVASMASAKPLK